MTEFKFNSLEKADGAKSELGKVADNANKLSEQELNAPVEDVSNLDIPEMASLDCSSECKYVTKGDSSKRMKFGYSG